MAKCLNVFNMPTIAVPLLSDHKTTFVCNRLLETLFGGFRFFIGTRVPCAVYLFQLVAHQLPTLIGCVFTILSETSVLSPLLAACCCGVVMTLVIGAVQITAIWLQRDSSPILQVQVKPGANLASALTEEDVVEFKPFCSLQTFRHLLPVRKFYLSSVVHSVFGGLVTGYGTLYLAPSRLSHLFASSGVTYFIFVLGWMTVCFAVFSLTVRAPQETATFQLLDPWEIKPLMRPFYVALCYTVDATLWYSSFQNTLNAAVHILFIFLPLMWFFNLFPPLDALFFWFLEQLQMWVAGGSPAASFSRLLFQLCLWSLSLVTIFFIPSNSALLVAAVIGYCLSLDINFLWQKFMARIRTKQKQKKCVSNEAHAVVTRWNQTDILQLFIMFILVLTLSLGLHFALPKATSDAVVISSLGWILLAMFLFSWTGSALQLVYLFGGLVRNNLYPSNTRQISVFTKRRRLLSILGKIRSIIINTVAPLVLNTYVTVLQVGRYSQAQESQCLKMWYCIATLRAFRWPWQQIESALLEFTIVHFLMMYTTVSQLVDDGTVLLLIAAVICDRVRSFSAKLHTFAVLLISSVVQEKQRRSYSCCLLGVNLLLFPLVLTIILFSSIISAPLLPFFTLPIFWLGFPRPTCFWPKKDTSFDEISEDAMYYEEIIPELVKKLGALISNGGLGEIRPGDDYLLRYDDRLLWLSFLERGYGHCRVVMKGLELQHTSCHAVEATAVDSILQLAFENEGTSQSSHCCRWNRTPFHVFSPKNTVLVETYVDTRNVLTGLITSPETLQLISDCFPKCLIWILSRRFGSQQRSSRSGSTGNAVSSEKQSETRQPDDKRQTSIVSTDGLPPCEARTLKSRPSTAERYAQLPKVPTGYDDASATSDPLDDPWLDEEDPLDSNPGTLERKPATVRLQPFVGILDEPDVISPAISILKDLHLPGTVDDAMEDKAFAWEKIADVCGVEGKLPKSPADTFGQVNFPKEWLRSPVSDELLRSLESHFPFEWYELVNRQIDIPPNGGGGGDEASREKKMERECRDVLLVYRRLILTCHIIVSQITAAGRRVTLSPNLVYRIFNRELPWSPLSDWLLQLPELYEFVIDAFRYACKLALDQVLFGDVQADSEIVDYLQEYDQTWFIGADNGPAWAEAVKLRVPNLFSLGYNPSIGAYTSHLLTHRLVPVYIGRLNREAVRAVWSSLSLELLYLTNDDEERYSIQAHSGLLRNLTVQGADPPLGYPVFVSQPLLIKTLPSQSFLHV